MAALFSLFLLQSFIFEGFPLLYHALNDPKALPDDLKPSPSAFRDPCGFSFLAESSIMKALDLLYHTLDNPKGLPDDPKPPLKPIREPWGSVIVDVHGPISANLASKHFILASSTMEGEGHRSTRRPNLSGPASNGSASSVSAHLAFFTASKERIKTTAHTPNMPSAQTTQPSTRTMTPTTPSPSATLPIFPSTPSKPSTKRSAPSFDKTKLLPLDVIRLLKTINITLSVRLVLLKCCPIRMASNA